MKALMWIIAIFISFSGTAQKVFTQDDLVAVVKKFHPVAKQALLDLRISEADITVSRGTFDPVANFDNDRKDFDGTTYYNQQSGELKIPVWYGVDIYTGSEKLRGERINPEETKGTINYVGISVPLVQNVIIDKRRAEIRKAKILKDQSEAERKIVLNNLVADALLAYWNWWEHHRQLEIVKSSLINAVTRFNMVKTMYQVGERPAIDTLEAATQVQFFEQQETEARMYLQKSKLQLSLFLWKEGDIAYDLPEEAIPETTQPDETYMIDSLLEEAALHPRLLEYDFKLRALAIDRRLKYQRLFPEVTARYNSISRELSKSLTNALMDNNYRFGISISMPIRLSEARGAYRSARLKIEQARLSQVAEQVTIRNKVQQYYTEWAQTKMQYRQQQGLVLNYLTLQKGEETKFANGESSLFLINAREAKTLEAQRKELSLEAKIQQAAVKLQQAAGVFGNN